MHVEVPTNVHVMMSRQQYGWRVGKKDTTSSLYNLGAAFSINNKPFANCLFCTRHFLGRAIG